MALDNATPIVPYDAPVKDLYELGEMPPLGHVPAKMYAWAIRRERHGEPDTAMQVEVVDTWKIDSNEVLVLVMAAGVNYNGVANSYNAGYTMYVSLLGRPQYAYYSPSFEASLEIGTWMGSTCWRCTRRPRCGAASPGSSPSAVTAAP